MITLVKDPAGTVVGRVQDHSSGMFQSIRDQTNRRDGTVRCYSIHLHQGR